MVLVTTQEGVLRGKTAKDLNGSEFFSFQGVPYAQPPIGELRFKVTVPNLIKTYFENLSTGPSTSSAMGRSKRCHFGEQREFINHQKDHRL